VRHCEPERHTRTLSSSCRLSDSKVKSCWDTIPKHLCVRVACLLRELRNLSKKPALFEKSIGECDDHRGSIQVR
jgi:hypothetical protein